MRQRQFAKKLEARRQVLEELDRQQRAGFDRQETPQWMRQGSPEENAPRPRRDPRAFERDLEERVRQGRD